CCTAMAGGRSMWPNTQFATPNGRNRSRPVNPTSTPSWPTSATMKWRSIPTIHTCAVRGWDCLASQKRTFTKRNCHNGRVNSHASRQIVTRGELADSSVKSSPDKHLTIRHEVAVSPPSQLVDILIGLPRGFGYAIAAPRREDDLHRAVQVDAMAGRD